jgi:hypothetical protein
MVGTGREVFEAIGKIGFQRLPPRSAKTRLEASTQYMVVIPAWQAISRGIHGILHIHNA